MARIPEICQIDECELQRAFIALLPDGPLWDRDKFEAACGDPCINTGRAPSMALYAAYTGSRLYDLTSNVLWPVLRESSPETAVDTLDDWLIRVGWDGCLNNRDFCCAPEPNPATLITISGQDGFVHDHPAYSTEFRGAIRRAIIRSVWRMRTGGIRNLEYVNWVLEPLGARIIADPNIPEGQCNCGDSSYCLIVTRLSDFIEGVPSASCGSEPSELVPAEVDGVWPTLWAAQMIALSLALPNCRTCIIRDDQYVPPEPPLNLVPPSLVCGDEMLIGNSGEWESQYPIQFTYEWLRDGNVIPGAIGITYTLQPEDFGTDISLRVTASSLIGVAVETTNICAISNVPEIVGTPSVSAVCPFMVLPALEWTYEPTSVSYQWSLDGVEVFGAQMPEFMVRPEDLGKIASVAITACNIRGCTTYNAPGAEVIACSPVFGFCEGYSGFCEGAEWDC